MTYEAPAFLELGPAEELTLCGPCGCCCDCCCGCRNSDADQSLNGLSQ